MPVLGAVGVGCAAASGLTMFVGIVADAAACASSDMAAAAVSEVRLRPGMNSLRYRSESPRG